uniref:Ig-like domain-containing protein n=1 Tax=Oryzias sinensis TaxID=183150 RepID=A0A8C8DRT1_9TELE
MGSRITVLDNGTLIVNTVIDKDAGEYLCVAQSTVGDDLQLMRVSVSMKPAKIESKLYRKKQIHLGNDLKVDCKATGAPTPEISWGLGGERIVSRTGKTIILNCSAHGSPKPEIVWTLPNGTRLNVGAYHGSHHHLNNDGTLVIYNSQKGDSGKYRCGAKNNLGYVEKLIILSIGHKPYILTRPRGIIRGMSGEPIFLHCLSDGSPPPRIFWTLPGGHTLTRPQVLGRYQLVENGTLVVKDTTLNDRGNYVCKAHNDAGEAVLTIPVVIIAYPPRITSGSPSTVRVVPGTPIQLNCAATGIPKPEITWELPDTTILSTLINFVLFLTVC